MNLVSYSFDRGELEDFVNYSIEMVLTEQINLGHITKEQGLVILEDYGFIVKPQSKFNYFFRNLFKNKDNIKQNSTLIFVKQLSLIKDPNLKEVSDD